MGETFRCLMLGAGGMGSRWIREIWQPFRDRIAFAGLVDPNPAALQEAGDWLGLPPAARFSDAREAFAAVDADLCCIVTPPDHHREAVELACARGMDILSEKPIADTLEACGAITRAVKAAGVRMIVTPNYRYTRRIRTLKQAVTELGAVNYAVARYASDYRQRGAWALFRHEMPHGLLIEGGIHHLDQLRNLCGADCQTIADWDWNPGHVGGNATAWRSSDAFDGEACARFVMRMTNGSFASYEGNNLATGKTKSPFHNCAGRTDPSLEGHQAVGRPPHATPMAHRSGISVSWRSPISWSRSQQLLAALIMRKKTVATNQPIASASPRRTCVPTQTTIA